MAVVSWPAELPDHFRIDGYSETLPDGRIVSNVDAGPQKMRGRSGGVRRVQAGIWLRPYMVARLNRFWLEETKRGTAAFSVRAQTGDGWPLLTAGLGRLLTSDGTPLLASRWWLVRFAGGEAPQITPFGKEFQAQFSLLILP